MSSAQAYRRARRLYPNSVAYQNTYVRGYMAAVAGRSIDTCPYRRDPAKSWANVWRRAWVRGFQSLDPDVEE